MSGNLWTLNLLEPYGPVQGLLYLFYLYYGHAVVQLVEVTALQAGRWRVRFPMVSLEFFIDNPSGRTVALGSAQLLTEMNTRNISWRWDKGSRCVGLTLPPSCADCLEIWEPQPPGTLRACPGQYRDCFTFYLRYDAG